MDIPFIKKEENMKVVYWTKQQFNNRMKTIETKNLKKHRRSRAWFSLISNFNECILCIHVEDSGNIMEIDEDKYKEIRAFVMSEEFCLPKEQNTNGG